MTQQRRRRHRDLPDVNWRVPYTPPVLERVGPRPRNQAEARDEAYMFGFLRRWHHVLEACHGDREEAARVWDEVGRAEYRGVRVS